MENETTINQRVKILIDYMDRGNTLAFSRRVHVSNQGLREITGERQSSPSHQNLLKLIEFLPEIRMEWLLLGQGPMLKSQQPEGAGLYSSEATVTESEALLKLAVAEARLEQKDQQLADKDRLIDRLWALAGVPEKVGKLLSSSDAVLMRLLNMLGIKSSMTEIASR